MKKKYYTFSLIGAVLLFVFFNLQKDNIKSKTETQRALHKTHLENSPFKSTLQLTKKERKLNKIPPNKYFEEEWELTMNPALGRPTPEKLKILQKELIQKRRSNSLTNKVPGEAGGTAWVERGPNNVGGRSRAIMFDPNDTNNETVFAGGVSGGLWKNINISSSTSQWVRGNIPENLAVSSITYDPNNTNVFYAGTGESYVGGDVNGDGLWKSVDGGTTWTKIFGGISGDSFFQSAYNITINSPASIAGDIFYRPTSSFGSTITQVITADLVLAQDATTEPTLGCETFTNATQMNGKIALIRRGSCNFTAKVKNAENAGAIAAVVMNNIPGDPIAMGGTDASITIPAVMISKEDGDMLENALATNTVNLSLNPRSGDFTGVLVPGIQHINDVVVRDNAGTSEIFVAAGDSFYSDANTATFLGGPEFGLYKSVDGGASWNEVSLPLTPNGNKYCPNDIEIGPDNTIWVATINSVIFGDGGGTVFSSADGNTFDKKHTITGASRTQIAISASNAQKIYLLAEGSTQPVVMERTDDDFATTTSLTLPDDADTDIPANDFTRGQAFYDLMLNVDPVDDDVVYAGGIDLFKTTDGGTTWNQISKWYEGLAGTPFGNLDVPLVHADHHNMAFDSSNNNRTLFVNDGGVFFSNDAGVTITSRNEGFNVTQFYSVGVGPISVYGGDYFIGGTQDNGTHVFQDADPINPDSSLEVIGGDGAYGFFDQDGTEAYFIGNLVYNQGIYLWDYEIGDWIEINSEDANNGSFINPEILDSNLNILYSNYSSGSNYIIRRYSGIKSSSTLAKKNFTDPLLTSRPTAFAISPYTVASTKLYVGTILGDILKVENANEDAPVWTDITGSEFVGSISDIEIGSNENEIFVTMHNYGVVNIWYTNDGGLNWQNKEGDLPDLPVKAIMRNPLNYNEVIIGTELGVWSTKNFFDATPLWNQAYNGMSNVKVTDLDLRDDNMVFASTYGRGIFSGEFKVDPNGDIDGDGVPNGIDICPQVANADQTDSDGDGVGDACQDSDKDSVLDINDNCPDNSNVDQADSDGNGVGDACQDSDNDGVVDVDDNCPDTANPDQTDTNGNGTGDVCDTSYENPDNIKLEVVSEKCPGANNGEVNITTKETYVTYTATISGEGINLTQGFTTTQTFKDLKVGSYIVCVSVDGKGYEQCFEITVDSAEPLGVVFEKTDGKPNTTSVIINEGTPPFDIDFNGEILRTTSETHFEIETIGSGILEVKTSKACEGTATKFIESNSSQLFASPNPVKDKLKVTIPANERTLIPVEIYNIKGQLLFNKTINRGSFNYIEIPFEKLTGGIYFVKINVEQPEVLKIVKKDEK